MKYASDCYRNLIVVGNRLQGGAQHDCGGIYLKPVYSIKVNNLIDNKFNAFIKLYPTELIEGDLLYIVYILIYFVDNNILDYK